ncbi:MAG: hypothetical protein K2J08_00465 [Ruminococcus sp.]|nr:hypothetical protein [Ruminococcus sp.]
MKRTIKSMENKYLIPALNIIEEVFTEHDSEKEGKMVRGLVEKIRSKNYYLPELELITRNNRSIPVCQNCQKVYSINQFMDSVEFD